MMEVWLFVGTWCIGFGIGCIVGALLGLRRAQSTSTLKCCGCGAEWRAEGALMCSACSAAS
jgi:hypothetical protein